MEERDRRSGSGGQAVDELWTGWRCRKAWEAEIERDRGSGSGGPTARPPPVDRIIPFNLAPPSLASFPCYFCSSRPWAVDGLWTGGSCRNSMGGG